MPYITGRKSLYTNVPVDEAIELATKLAYDGLEPPPFDRAVFQKLLHLALTNVFKTLVRARCCCLNVVAGGIVKPKVWPWGHLFPWCWPTFG